jgi:hypothetical protein
LVSVPVIEGVTFVPAAPPVSPPVTAGAAQIYVVPAGTIVPGGAFAGVTVNKLPLHTEAVVLEITGLGFTVTVIVKLAPGQAGAADVGVTV